MTWLRRIALVSTVLALVLAATPGPAGAADPPGTVVLTRGHGSQPQDPQILSTTAHYLIYRTNNEIYARKYTQHTSTRITVGSFANYEGGSGDPSDDYIWLTRRDSSPTARWLNLADPSDTGSVPRKWDVEGPGGGIWLQGRDLMMQTYAQAGSGRSSMLARLPSYVARNGSELLVGPKGVAAITNLLEVKTRMVNYVDFASHTVHPIHTTHDDGLLRCDSLSSNAMGCADGDHPNEVERLSLSGRAPVLTAVGSDPVGVTVTDTTTAWQNVSASHAASVPAAGSPTTALVHFHLPGFASNLSAHGNSIYLVRTGTLAQAGIYRTRDATEKPTKLVTSPREQRITDAVTLSPGRVAWSDNSTSTWPVRYRALTTRGTTIIAGPPTVAGASGQTGQNDVSTSGSRTAWAFDPHRYPGEPVKVEIRSGRRTVRAARGAAEPITLSGSRLLYLEFSGNHEILDDLATHSRTDLTRTLHATAVALWGDELVYAHADGSIWEKNLSSAAPGTLVRAAGPASSEKYQTDVYVFGDWVAWSRTSDDESFDQGYRNARTHGPITPIAQSRQLGSATADGVVLANRHDNWRLLPWSGKQLITLPNSVRPPAVDDSLVAWSGTDDQLHVARLPRHFAQRPRSLGDPLTGHRVKRGRAWRLDLATSAPLTACRVDIRASTTRTTRTVASLPCNTRAMASGEIRVHWTPSDVVHPRKEHWVIRARSADGWLLNADGTQARTRGVLHVV